MSKSRTFITKVLKDVFEVVNLDIFADINLEDLAAELSDKETSQEMMNSKLADPEDSPATPKSSSNLDLFSDNFRRRYCILIKICLFLYWQ